MKKAIFLAFVCIFLSSCAAKFDEFMQKEALQIQPNLSELDQIQSWWKAYENEPISLIIEALLRHNSQINVARYSLLSAVARYKLINFDLYPSLSGNLGASIAKDLNLGTRSNAFSNALNLSYELDLYGKIIDEKSSAEFSARASLYELESLKLSLINQGINNSFELVYFNDVEKLLKEYISNLEEAKRIYTLKYELGRVEELDLLNIEQSLLNAKQNLLQNEQNKELILKTLKDLLGNKDSFTLIDRLLELSLSDFKELSVNFDLSLEAFTNRPDVKASASSLSAAFKSYKAVQKSMYPTVSLGASLSGNSAELNESFKLVNLGGVFQLSLPFLDYGRVRQNVQISKFAYESLKTSYEQVLQGAINEFYACYKDYEYNIKLYENIKLINSKEALITKAYLQKYELGRAELKDYLDARNSFINSSQEILRSRLNLLKTINSYFQITAKSESL